MSANPRAAELMQARIDGAITEAENAELQQFFEQDPALETQFSGLMKVAAELDGLPVVDPPVSVRAVVLASNRSSSPGTPDQPRARTGLVPRYAYAAAAGLILGVLGYHLAIQGPFRRPTVDPAEFAGTMSSTAAPTISAVVDELALDLPAVRGVAQIALTGSRLAVLVELDSQESLDVELVFEGGEVGFREFVQRGGEVDGLEVDGESVAWSQRGPHQLTVVFDLRTQASTSIELRLNRLGSVVYTESLTIPRPVSSPVGEPKVE